MLERQRMDFYSKLDCYFTHQTSVQLYFEGFRLRGWRCLNFEPVLTVVHRLLTLLIQAVEGQHLANTKIHTNQQMFLVSV